MKCIILAAGVGRRLRPITNHTPKCLIQINGEPLIDSYFRAFEKTGVNDVVLVVGHMAETLKRKIGRKYMSLDVSYVHNPDYASSNSAYSLWLAKDEILDAPFVLADGDILFDEAILERLVNSSYENCLVADRVFVDTGEEVKVAEEGGIVKQLGKQIVNHYQVVGESVGLYKFSINVSHLLVQGLDKYINDNGRNSEYEDALNSFLPAFEMHYITTGGLQWIDIDFPGDLKKAKLLLRKLTDNKRHLSTGVTLRKGSTDDQDILASRKRNIAA
jgi:choline kinase